MFNSMIVAVALAQTPVSAVSPLELHLEALLEAPVEVQHEFIDQVITDWNMPLWRYIRYSPEQQRQMVERAYYLQALTKAILVHEGDPDLVSILDELADRSVEVKTVALKFNREYKRKFGKWPPIVPVDVAALSARMLRNRTIR